MADATPSNLVKGQALFNSKYKSQEFKLPDTAALSVAYTGEKANPALAALRTREDRLVSAYLPIRRAKAAATERLYNHTGARGDSLEVPVTWQSSVDTFSISIKQYDNNLLSFEEAWATEMQNAAYNILIDLESKFIASLTAGRTQVNVGGVNGTFNSTDNVMELLASDKDYFYQQIQANMNQNLYKGRIAVIVDSLAAIFGARQANQGTGNATNLGWQFNNMNVVQSTSAILDGLTNTYTGAAIAFPMDSAGIVPWIPKQNRKALDPVKAMSELGDFGSINIPVYDDKGGVKYNLPMALHAYAQRADTSSNNGSKQDVLIQVEASLDTAYVDAPLSTFRGSNDSVVYGFGQLA